MSINDRRFVRRQIVWRIADLKQCLSENGLTTPKFTLLLGENKTEWCVEACEENLKLMVYLHKVHVDRAEFSMRFNLAVIKMTPKPTCVRSIFYCRSFDEKPQNIAIRGFQIISLDELFFNKDHVVDGIDLTIEMQLELIEHCKLKIHFEEIKHFDNFTDFNNEKYSDFVFLCLGGKKVYAQKAIIAVQCEAFALMIDAGLSETYTRLDYRTIMELVRYLHYGLVQNIKQVHERLVVAASQYALDDLKAICVSSLMESLTERNVVNVFKIAEQLDDNHLKRNCVDFIKCNHFRLQGWFEKRHFRKELLWALWKSTDFDPIRIIFQTGKTVTSVSPLAST